MIWCTFALYCNNNAMEPIKFVKDSDDRIEGYGIPYGGPMGGKDLDGEAFTKDTDFALDWYDKRPLLMWHGKTKEFGLKKIGDVVKAERRDQGVWVEAIITASKKYKTSIAKLVKKGHLHFSNGSGSQYTKVAGDGTIQRWPFMEMSLVPIPANPEATAAMKSAGFTLLEETKEQAVDIDELVERVAARTVELQKQTTEAQADQNAKAAEARAKSLLWELEDAE